MKVLNLEFVRVMSHDYLYKDLVYYRQKDILYISLYPHSRLDLLEYFLK